MPLDFHLSSGNRTDPTAAPALRAAAKRQARRRAGRPPAPCAPSDFALPTLPGGRLIHHRAPPFTVRPLVLSMVFAPLRAPLVLAPSPPFGSLSRSLPTRPATVSVAPVATAADPERSLTLNAPSHSDLDFHRTRAAVGLCRRPLDSRTKMWQIEVLVVSVPLRGTTWTRGPGVVFRVLTHLRSARLP
jgi:hypothetical protein